MSLIRYNPATRLFTKIFGTHGGRAAVPDGGSWGLPDCPEGALILDTGSGSGLVGLERVEALGGRLSIGSPAGQGTTLSIELPLTPPHAV